ncbi:hyalin-like [Amphiura filiformis]|uniref:hyalin-like n=1 Tax=Amphiura filiformis TaxID=82378 RepID=UPI003B2270F8
MVIMTNWTSILFLFLSLYIFADETNATVTDVNSVYTVINCPVGVGYIPIDATGNGPATWIEPTATSTNAGDITLVTRTRQPGDTFMFNENTQVTYQWQDAAGAFALCQFWIRLQTPGVITVNSCPTSPMTATSNGSPVVVTWTTPTATSTSGATVNSASLSPTHYPGWTFIAGDTVVEYYWQDTNDNYANCIFTISVILDQQSPSLNNCPSDMSVSSNQVHWTDPTATDNIDTSPTVSCIPPSGEFFSTGDTTVTCIATDDATNTATCTFTVTLVDVIPPTVNCPDNIMSSENVVNWMTPTASDSSGIAGVVSCDPPSGGSFPNGETIVTCTATDGAGNTGMCTFTVTVAVTDPNSALNADSAFTVSNCPVGVGYIPIDATGDGPATWIEPTATSTNGGVTRIARTHQPGDTFIFNQNTQVTYQWEDAANKFATCQFTIRLQNAGENYPKGVISYLRIAVPLYKYS